MDNLIQYWWVALLVFVVLGCFVTINQGLIGVVTMFGKYQRIMRPGLNFKIPFLEQILKTLWRNRALLKLLDRLTYRDKT